MQTKDEEINRHKFFARVALIFLVEVFMFSCHNLQPIRSEILLDYTIPILKLVDLVKFACDLEILVQLFSGDNLIVGSYDRRLCWFDMDLSTKPYKTLRLVITFVENEFFLSPFRLRRARKVGMKYPQKT